MTRKRRPDAMPFVTLKNIGRLEKAGYGWRVHIKRRGREYTKYFPDGWDGPFESLRQAIAWRDEAWLRLGPPTHAASKPTTRSSSGVLGVTREVQNTASDRVVENYRASWCDSTGRVRRRTFSVDKYGEEEAKRLALEARHAGLKAAGKAKRQMMLDVLHTHRQLVGGQASTALPSAKSVKP